MRDLDQIRTHVTRLSRALLFAFAFMSVWLAYWHVVASPALSADPGNPRAKERLKSTEPGRVVTADGKGVLSGARSQQQWYLEYPGADLYCHLTGYNERTGLQASLHEALFGLGRYADPWVRLLRGKGQGCEITLTLNSGAQTAAATGLMGREGAVVALDPRTGAVLALVSSPGYDPQSILDSTTDYDLFRTSPAKPELNRALQGLYAPGSVLKIFTAAAALDAGKALPTDEYECKGELEIAGTTVKCHSRGGHGRIGLTDAIAQSCNVAFAELGNSLGAAVFGDYVTRFHLLEAPDLALPASRGRMASMSGPSGEAQLVEAAFGQGATLVSPAMMARLAATIAAEGNVPRLQLIQRIALPNGGRALAELRPEVLGRAVSPETARTVAGMMVEVVERGTGRGAGISGVSVAGKTGSAENPSGEPHAWFIGFAPAESPTVAVAVVVEHGGAGGEAAAPIAARVIEECLRR
jgi:penicillin-binding protein A